MPSKCTKCGKVHPDKATYLINRGCDACGSRFFFFIKEEELSEAEREIENLSREEMQEIEQDIRDIVSAEKPISSEDTVILDLEAIRVIKPGKYRIDVTSLFSQKPIVIRVGPGKYKLDLSTLMRKPKKR